jgi:hypothetical protein
MIPRIAPEGTTYGASFDLNPPLARKITRANAKPYSKPYRAPCHHALELVKDKAVKRATRVPFKIAATRIWILKGSSGAKKIPTPSSAPTTAPINKVTEMLMFLSRSLFVLSRNSTPHDMNCQDAALVTR